MVASHHSTKVATPAGSSPRIFTTHLQWIQLFAESRTARGIAIDRDDCRKNQAEKDSGRAISLSIHSKEPLQADYSAPAGSIAPANAVSKAGCGRGAVATDPWG